MPFTNRPCWPTGVLCFLIASGFLLYVVQNSARVSLGLCGRLGHGSLEPDHLDGTKTTFRQMPVLEDMSHEGNEAWAAALMPRNQGLVPVRHNETFSLQVGISMFHALHCLGMLRTMLQARVDSHLDRRGDSHEHPTMADEANKFLHGVHMPHCLGYIAQVPPLANNEKTSIGTPILINRKVHRLRRRRHNRDAVAGKRQRRKHCEAGHRRQWDGAPVQGCYTTVEGCEPRDAFGSLGMEEWRYGCKHLCKSTIIRWLAVRFDDS